MWFGMARTKASIPGRKSWTGSAALRCSIRMRATLARSCSFDMVSARPCPGAEGARVGRAG